MLMTQEDQREERSPQRAADQVFPVFHRRRFFEIAGLAGVTAALASCGTIGQTSPSNQSSGSGWAKGIRIRFFAGGNPGDAFASIVLSGAKRAQADLGPTVDYIFSGWDVETMTNQLREAVAARPDAIAMMGHPGDVAISPLAQQAHSQGVVMEYQNVDVPKVRSEFGGGYIGANLAAQGGALGQQAIGLLGLKSGDKAIVFGAWGQPGRYIREEGTARALEAAGLSVQRIVSPPAAASDPNTLTPILSSAFRRNPDTKLIVQAGGQTLAATQQYMRAIGKGPGQLYNIGFDLNPSVLDAIKSGYVQLTSDQQPFLQGYLPILSLCLTKKWLFAPLSYDTSAAFVTNNNYQSFTELVKEGIR
jgi:simple sugar transport system substrate-binding protein